MAPRRKYTGLLNDIGELPERIQKYFYPIEDLINNYDLEISLTYAFSILEQGQNRALYCGLVKIHRVHKSIAELAIDNQHIDRRFFRGMYENIFGNKIPENVIGLIKEAEGTRDKVVHGKKATYQDLITATYDVLNYANRLNELSYSIASIRPFGDLRGFKGAKLPLEKSTSRLVVKGLGFELS